MTRFALPVLLLIASNIFMTFAWYGHLRHKQSALWLAILISWLIAFFEYCLQVPANRIGHNSGFSGAQLKTIQEVITLAVFCVFSVYYLKEAISWNMIIGFALIIIGATFIFEPWKPAPPTVPTAPGAPALVIPQNPS